MTKNPTKAAIRKILSECVFNPREPGPLKVIADVGNEDYYITRATELLKRAETDQAKVNIRSAISLLALALAKFDQ